MNRKADQEEQRRQELKKLAFEKKQINEEEKERKLNDREA